MASYPAQGDRYFIRCSAKFSAGEMPIVIPPSDFAPLIASWGRPGHAPVTRTYPRRATSWPRRKAFSVISFARWPPADPITPIEILCFQRGGAGSFAEALD